MNIIIKNFTGNNDIDTLLNSMNNVNCVNEEASLYVAIGTKSQLENVELDSKYLLLTDEELDANNMVLNLSVSSIKFVIETLLSLVSGTGLVSIDIEDIKTVVNGSFCVSIGNDIDHIVAVEKALEINPSFDVKTTQSVIFNIVSSDSLMLITTNEMVDKLRGNLPENANIIFGFEIRKDVVGFRVELLLA